MKTEFIASGKARLATWVAGDGAPIVFLHAGVADKRMWRVQMENFSVARRTIAYDRRGFGETTYEAEPHDYTVDLKAIIDNNGGAPVVLVGCSQGGRLAIDYTLTYPQSVKALVLSGSAITGQVYSDETNPKIIALDAALTAADEAKDIDRLNELEAQAWLDGPTSEPGRVSGFVRDLFLDMNGIALRAAPTGQEKPTTNAWTRLAEIQVPTLVVCGDLDYPDVRRGSEHLHSSIPGARYEIMAGTAHLPNLEQPTRFTALVGDFLSSISR